VTGRLTKLPKGAVEPTIITGLDALGRGQDLSRLRGFLQDFTALAQIKPAAVERLDDADLIQRLANGHGVSISGLIRTEEQMAAMAAQQQQQAMQQEIVSKATGPAVSAMAKAAEGQQA